MIVVGGSASVRLAEGVAKELGVTHILQGSVRKSGNQLRISTQLIDAREDAQLWSQTFDRPIDDVFAIQDEIAAAVIPGRHMQVDDTRSKLLGVFENGVPGFEAV